jgi:hypothetical protein
MHKANAAERILEMATTSNSAASTIGDLLEESSHRSVFWFWSSVMRILAVHIGHDLNRCKLKIVGIVFLMLLDILVLSFGLGVLTELFQNFGLNPFLTQNWIGATFQVGVLLLVGWNAASRTEGCELALCIVLTSFMAVLRLIAFRSASHPLIFIWLCVMAGAVFFRYRANVRYRKIQSR